MSTIQNKTVFIFFSSDNKPGPPPESLPEPPVTHAASGRFRAAKSSGSATFENEAVSASFGRATFGNEAVSVSSGSATFGNEAVSASSGSATFGNEAVSASSGSATFGKFDFPDELLDRKMRNLTFPNVRKVPHFEMRSFQAIRKASFQPHPPLRNFRGQRKEEFLHKKAPTSVGVRAYESAVPVQRFISSVL